MRIRVKAKIFLCIMPLDMSATAKEPTYKYNAYAKRPVKYADNQQTLRKNGKIRKKGRFRNLIPLILRFLKSTDLHKSVNKKS